MKKIIFVTVLFLISCGLWWSTVSVPSSETAVDLESSVDVGIINLSTGTSRYESIRSGYFDFLASPSVKTWKKMLYEKEQRPATLSDFLQAIGMKVDDGLVSRLDQNEWYLYRCASVNNDVHGGGNVVLATRFLRPEDSLDIQRNLLAWESTMIAFVSQLLFPYDLYRADPTVVGSFSAAPEYSYATLRTVPVQVDGYGQAEIGYLYFDQVLLIGGDRHCLREAEERLFEVVGE